jgi:thioredoxin 1
MKRTIMLGMLVPLTLLALGCNPGSSPKKKGAALTEAEWEKNVLRDPGPVLVDFGATWCAPCREMEPIIAQLENDYKVVRIDVDENQDLAIQMKISVIPAIFIFVDGKVAKRFVGPTRESTLRNELAQLSRK